MLSYEKIIKMLQEELYKKELPKNAESSEQEYVGDRFKAQEDWAQVTSKKYRKREVSNRNLTQIIPTTNNRYERLSNLKDEETVIGTSKAVKICNSSNYPQVRKKNQIGKSVGRSEHKVMIIGDSHAKKCAAELRHNLDRRYEVYGFIKPGASSNEVIKTVEEEVSSLKHKDVVILWGGSNDISRNNTKEALKNLSNFMNSNKNVNTILINPPHRHDLRPSSCVNNEVARFNRQIRKIVKLHENVKLLEVKLQREHFTKHGQHLNNSGKELVALELAKLVEQLVNKKKTATIEMQWKEDNADLHSETEKSMDHCDTKDSLKLSKGEVGKTKSDVLSHAKDREVRAEEICRILDDRKQIGRTSSRQNKATTTRSEDFLW
jgi:hypothetical protein